MCSLGENPATADPFTVENRFPELGFASVITPVGFQLARYRHNRPIASHFHSGGLEFSYLGQDLDEADGESEETIARITVRERTAEHLHDVLSGD
jgi:hypothetical protein